MPDWLKFPLVLVTVTIISAASLALLNSVTEPARIAEAAAVKKAALSVVLPSAEKFKEKGKGKKIGKMGFSYHEGLDSGGRVIGYAATGEAAGYSSIIRVMVGVDTDFKIVAIKVLSQNETPGLGDKIVEVIKAGLRPWFQVQFDGKSVPVMVKKDGGGIDAITGATISSRAVCHAVNEAVSNLQLAISRSP